MKLLYSNYIFMCLFVLYSVHSTGVWSWDLEDFNSVLQSHSEHFRKIYEKLQKTDYIWDWFHANKNDLSDVMSNKRSGIRKEETENSEYQNYISEMQNYVRVELSKFKIEMKKEFQTDEELRNTKLEKKELNDTIREIKLVNESCLETIDKVTEYSRSIVANVNTTIEKSIYIIRSQVHGVIESLSHAQKKMEFLENRMHSTETLLKDKLLNFTGGEEPIGLSNDSQWDRTNFTGIVNYSMEDLFRQLEVFKEEINELKKTDLVIVKNITDILNSKIGSLEMTGGIGGRNLLRGWNGLPGPKGDTGPKGEKGSMGPGGLTGIGQKGKKGSMGSKGEKGTNGPGGLPGMGQKGETGSIG